MYQDGTGYITNIRECLDAFFYDVPDTFACKWEIEDNKWEIEDKKITIISMYFTFEIYVKDKNELYMYNGDPDEFDIFSFKRIKNKE